MADQLAVCFSTLKHDQPWSLEAYLKEDGYKAWKGILKKKTAPEKIIEEVKTSS